MSLDEGAVSLDENSVSVDRKEVKLDECAVHSGRVTGGMRLAKVTREKVGWE